MRSAAKWRILLVVASESAASVSVASSSLAVAAAAVAAAAHAAAAHAAAASATTTVPAAVTSTLSSSAVAAAAAARIEGRVCLFVRGELRICIGLAVASALALAPARYRKPGGSVARQPPQRIAE